ncbi:hypothetical protein JCM10207_002691 [Rhodosporidiobolus poonsookiae]
MPSIAQDLPFDVLISIFQAVLTTSCERVQEELMEWPVAASSPTVRALSLVCRGWRAAGQSTLWRSVVFSHKKQCQLFIRTARDRPDLAKQVRAVSVGRLQRQPVENDNSDAAWAELSALMLDALAECRQCRHLHIAPLHEAVATRVFDVIREQPLPLHSLITRLFDAHRGLAPDLCIAFYLNIFDLFDRLPKFTHYEINFRPPYLPTREEVALPVLPSSSITSFHSTVNSVEAFLQALRMMPLLKILNVYTEWSMDDAEASSVFASLKHLEELRVESNVPATAGDGGNFWLNRLLPSYPLLRRLSVTEQDALPCQFSAPPPSLELLEFIHFGARPDSRFYEFEELLDAASADQSRFAALEFIFVADEEAFNQTVDPEDVQDLVRKYAERGVKFSVVHEIMELPERRIVEF